MVFVTVAGKLSVKYVGPRQLLEIQEYGDERIFHG